MSGLWFASSAADLLSAEERAGLSGLEFMQGILAGRYPAPPIGKTLNFQLEAVEQGRVVFRGTPQFGAMNPIGTVHGGWFGTLLDSCMACAVHTTVPAGRGYTTLEYKINILRAVLPDSGEYRAIGEVTHAGRRTGVAEGRIEQVNSGKIVARGSTTCLIMDL